MKKLIFLFLFALIIQTEALSQSCLPDGIHFYHQTTIDSFQVNYPNCTKIEGNVKIGGPNITNLSGLSVLTSIGGFLWVLDNPELNSLSGLDNITYVGGILNINNNDALTNLMGLHNIDSVNNKLVIIYNDGIANLSGLESITFINRGLLIWYNNKLTSLSGIDNIDALSIDTLDIRGNPSLSSCEVKSVCDYLANPTGGTVIQNNHSGCNSPEEVITACENLSVTNNNFEYLIKVFPNPAVDEISILSKNSFVINELTIYNQLGQKVLHRNEISESIDISTLGQGIYIIELTSSTLKMRQKLIIEE